MVLSDLKRFNNYWGMLQLMNKKGSVLAIIFTLMVSARGTKNACVVNLLHEIGSLNPRFLRSFYDGELELFVSLLACSPYC